jgi:hypothetical protein
MAALIYSRGALDRENRIAAALQNLAMEYRAIMFYPGFPKKFASCANASSYPSLLARDL